MRTTFLSFAAFVSAVFVTAATLEAGPPGLQSRNPNPGVLPPQSNAYGQSLGGAVAVVVAADRPEISAVVAESPFSAYRRIAARVARRLVFSQWLANGLAALTVSAGHDPIDVVDRLPPRPLLVIVAGEDEICFPELGRELFDAASQPKDFWLAPGSEHLGIAGDHYSELIERITRFFEQATPP